MDFKEYVTSILYIAIFAIILELFLPNTKLKKYVSSFISLLIILTIISPVFNFLKGNGVEEAIDNALLAISNNTGTSNATQQGDLKFKEYMNTTIVSRVKTNLEEELFDKFSKNLKDITTVEKVEVELNDDYKIEEVIVYTTDGSISMAKLVLDKIISEYDIPSNMLKIVNKGE